MKYIVTPSELVTKGCWEKYCEVTGTNFYALNEGLIDTHKEIVLTEEQAKKIGLIKGKY